MRYRVKEYNITGDTDFSIVGKVLIEDIRLIINETQKKVICSSMNKSNVTCDYDEDMDVTSISFDTSICQLQNTDQLTIEIDKGDDLSAVARQGENQEATNSAIYNAVKHLPDLSQLYAARAEKNNDGENTYSIILPVSAKAIIDDNGVATIQL